MMDRDNRVAHERYIEVLADFDKRAYENKKNSNESVAIVGALIIFVVIACLCVGARDSAETIIGIFFFGMIIPFGSVALFLGVIKSSNDENEASKSIADEIEKIVGTIPADDEIKLMDMNVAALVKQGLIQDVSVEKLASARRKNMAAYFTAIEEVMRRINKEFDYDLDVADLNLKMVFKGISWDSISGTYSCRGGYGGGGHDPRSYSFENDYGGYGNDIYVGGNFVDF